MNLNRTDRRHPPRQQQGGFVLVIVLALLVVLTMLAAAVAASGSRAVSGTQRDVDRFQGELDMLSTRETMLYMLATQGRNIAGLAPLPPPPSSRASTDDDEAVHILPTGQEIRLDGSAYKGLGDSRFALQDDRGLLSPNWAAESMLHALYASLGAPAGTWRDLDAKRLDYQDPDSLHRLGGAEEPQYVEAGKPPPSNRPVATPLEFRRILDWDELLQELDDAQVLGLLTVARGSTLNLNSAPAEVLALIPGMNRSEAERLVAIRRQLPITSPSALAQSFPIAPFMQDSLTLFPSRSGNLILWDTRFGGRRLLHWRMTPLTIGGPPWQIDYEVILPRDNQLDDRAVVEEPATPLFSPQDPAGAGIEPGA